MTKPLPKGCFIAKKAIRCWKEFIARRGEYYAPVQDTLWGRLKPGMVLQCQAARSSQDCARGVHAWSHKTTNFGGNSLWLCEIPKGTFVHKAKCRDKYRADAIKLIKEITLP